MKFKKGFTLIELLVVIAIIGLLASVILASLNAARAKGADAAIKANLEGVRSQAALFYSDNENYGTDEYVGECSAATAQTLFVLDSKVMQAIDAADALVTADGFSFVFEVQCVSGAQYWAVAAPLKTNNNRYWCVDSVGNSKEIDFVEFDNVSSTFCP